MAKESMAAVDHWISSSSNHPRKTRWSYDNTWVTEEDEDLDERCKYFIPIDSPSSEDEDEDDSSNSDKEREKMFGEERMKILKERLRRRSETIALIANSEENNPEMSMEMLNWLECHNQWRYSGRRTATFHGGPPPLPEAGNPDSRARIKVPEHLKSYVRPAEMATEFYNKNHQDSDFEVVEILSGHPFNIRGDWFHLNFTAKPKSASPDNKEPLKTFFAEHFNDDSDFGVPRRKVTEGLITSCCLLEEGSTSTRNCEVCPNKKKIRHPLDGEAYLFNVEVYL